MIKITKAGWIYIILTIFLGVAAINTGNNLLYLIVSAMLSFMAVSGYFGKKNMSKIDVDIETPFEVYAGTPAILKIVVKNRKRFFSSFLLKVYLEGKTSVIPYIKPDSEHQVDFSLVFSERGEKKIKYIKVCSPFPFNFFVRCLSFEKNITVVVYPKPEKCSLNIFSPYGKKEEREVGKGIGYEGDFSSIKEYYPGIPKKYIHWKSSAKSENLKVKEFEKPLYKSHIIDFNSVNIPNLEKKISCLTYVVLKLFKERKEFIFRINGKTYSGLKDKQKILKELAVYGKDKS